MRSPRSLQRRRHAQHRKTRRWLVETLEDRRLLNADFPNFADPAGLNLVGTAAATSNVLRLAPLDGGTGAAWLDEPQYVALDFETTFEFQLGDGAGGPGGSDGFAFVIQASSDTALGGGGGNLGYATIPNSLAVEFDIFRNNSFNDPDSSHVSVHTNGLGANRAEEAFSLGAFSPPGFDLDDGNVHTARIVYQTVSDTLSVFLDDLQTPALSVSIDLPRTLELDEGRAWVGFTAATGGGPTNHDILSWQYDSAADLSPVLAIADVTALEGSSGGSEEFAFTVTRIGAAATAANVAFTVTDGTAEAGDDFVAASGSLSIPAGVVEQTIAVSVNRDDTEEPHEEFFVTLSNPAGIGLGDARARGTILNDEATITIDDTRGREDNHAGLFREFFVEAPQFLNTGITFGPDGNLYVSRPRSDEILRFDGVTGESLGTFVSPGSGGVDVPAITGLQFGADGHLYVPSRDTDSVLRYDGTTGAFIDTFVTPGLGGLERPKGMEFGPDGHLYVGSARTDEVFKYDGTDGSLLGVFVTAGSGGLQEPRGLTFGPDGHLYVGDQFGDSVLRYDGSTGEFLDIFVSPGSGGLDNTSGLVFGPDGRLFVVSESSQQVLVYDSAGKFLETIVPTGESPLDRPRDLVFGPDGDLYVTDFSGVARFTVQPRLAFEVNLSQPVGQTVTVNYTTAGGTAVAGADYSPISGSLYFGPQKTSALVIVPLLVTSEIEPNKTLLVNLSIASSGASLGDAQAVGTIVDQHAPHTTVTAVAPAGGGGSVPAATDVSATFDRLIDAASATLQSFVVHSSLRGQLVDTAATVSTDGQTVTLDPAADFLPGELVQATATGQLHSTTAGSAIPHVWQFRTAATSGTGVFEESQQLGDLHSFDVALGDLDGDGDLDAFVANGSPNGEGDMGNRVWLNSGGQFSDSGQVLGDHKSRAVALGDLDGDGDLDAFVASNDGNRVWRNNGQGQFVDTGQRIDDLLANAVKLGDLDGDGDLDAVTAGDFSASLAWLNDGEGHFTRGNAVGGLYAEDIALGDLDNDGDLDVFVAYDQGQRGQANEILFNDGTGEFSDRTFLGDHSSRGIELGDLDGDGDLDAFVANSRQANRVWLNNGSGGFLDSGQLLGNGEARDVALGDVDADGDLDAVVANYFSGSGADVVWLNNGNGRFSDSGQELTNRPSTGIALGDLDGDGDLDIFTSNRGSTQGVANSVVLNQTPTSPLVTLSRDRAAIAEDGGVAVFTVTLAEPTAVPVTVELATGGTATAGVDYTTGNLNLIMAAGETTVSTQVTALDDTVFDPDETVILEIVSATNATLLGLQRQTTVITDNEPQPPAVTAVIPATNSHNAATATNISATFEENITAPSVTTENFVVHAGSSGQLQPADAVVSASGPTITLDPVGGFFPGELVSVTATSAIESVAGPVGPFVWQFRAAASGGSGLFEGVSSSLGDQDSFDVELGDLDGDGDLDAFVANDFENRVWFNEAGRMVDGGQLLGDGFSTAVELGDLDGDGDLDAFVTNFMAGDRVWLNTGGRFSDSGQSLGRDLTTDVALGDVDGDGDLDALATGPYSSRLWLNEAGDFTDSGQPLPGGVEITLADADEDGDLDAWLNVFGGVRLLRNHRGQFGDAGQNLGDGGFASAVGDLDQDGDLDLFVSVGDTFGNQVFLNDGGHFTDSGQRLGDHSAGTVTLGDLDGDGDLDAFIAAFEGGNRVWLNQGDGEFRATGQARGNAESTNAALGDLDGDGDLDAFVAVFGGNQLWMNTVSPPPPEVTLGVDPTVIAEAAGVATLTAELSAPSPLPVVVKLGVGGTATPNLDYLLSSTEIFIAAGTTTGSATITAVQDTADEEDETVVIEIVEVINAVEQTEQQSLVTILDDDAPPVLAVTALTPTASGFTADFNLELDRTELNLYDTATAGAGVADLTLTGAATGPVAGSLVVDPSSRRVTFIKSGNRLVADTYTVRLRSGMDAFRDASGGLLDGNGDGSAGDDYTGSFIVSPPQQDSLTLSLPDFVRGPGQPVNLPTDTTNGIPVRISEGTNVRAIDLQVSYDPELLTISAASVADGMPAGASVVANSVEAGRLVLVFFSPTPLPAGSHTFVNLQASVPESSAYGRQNLLQLHSATVSDGNDNEFPTVTDAALQLASYFGDVSGNRRINAADAAQVARIAALIDGGGSVSLISDPLITADISGNGRINAADASRVARFAALLPVEEIPPLPAGGGLSAFAGGLSPAAGIPERALGLGDSELGLPASDSDRDRARQTPTTWEFEQAAIPADVLGHAAATDAVMVGQPNTVSDQDDLLASLEDLIQARIASE